MFTSVRRVLTGLRSLLHAPARLEAIERALRDQHKWQRLVSLRLDALIRAQYLDPADFPMPARITARRFQLKSQHDEDGITWALLREAGTVTRRFVEIGSGGSGGNSAFLALECGWAGLMVDAAEICVQRASRKFAVNPRVVVTRAIVTAENVNEVLDRHGMTGEVDLLSIDIDSEDYWVWEALTVCSPRVVVVEYNAWFGRDRAVTVPRNRPHAAIKGYHGASLKALARLGELKGYRLVLCEPHGVNAFFVRNDLAPEIPAARPEVAYRPMIDRSEPIGDVERWKDVESASRRLDLPLVEV
jgi:hypothetical protein